MDAAYMLRVDEAGNRGFYLVVVECMCRGDRDLKVGFIDQNAAAPVPWHDGWGRCGWRLFNKLCELAAHWRSAQEGSSHPLPSSRSASLGRTSFQYGRMHPISCRLLIPFANNSLRLCPVPRFGYENPGCLQAYPDRAKGIRSIPTTSSGHNESRRSPSERCQDQIGRALSLLFRRYPPRASGSQDAAF
jgi:hypothetical protein